MTWEKIPGCIACPVWIDDNCPLCRLRERNPLEEISLRIRKNLTESEKAENQRDDWLSHTDEE